MVFGFDDSYLERAATGAMTSPKCDDLRLPAGAMRRRRLPFGLKRGGGGRSLRARTAKGRACAGEHVLLLVLVLVVDSAAMLPSRLGLWCGLWLAASVRRTIPGGRGSLPRGPRTFLEPGVEGDFLGLLFLSRGRGG